MNTVSKFLFYFFFSIIGGSILTISTMNFLELDTYILPWFLIFYTAVTIFIIKKSKIDIPVLNRRELIISFTISSLLILPRLHYLLEPIFKSSFDPVCWDDYWHIQEHSSLVFSEKFPVKSTFDQHLLFSFYYASWVPGIFIYLLGILKTVKQAVFINFALWQIAFPYLFFTISKLLKFKAKFNKNLFLIIVFCFAGADFFFAIIKIIQIIIQQKIVDLNVGWWMSIFGFKLQFSNFFILSLWVPHHYISALTIIFTLLFQIKKNFNIYAILLCAILFSFALFSSVFVFIGSLPLIAYLLLTKKIIFKNFFFIGIGSFVICLPLLWMYLGKHKSLGFLVFGALENSRNPIIVNFLIFLFIIILEFLPLIALLLKSKKQHALIIISFMYILSTFFIAYSGSNNYAIRGSIIPILTIYYLTANSISRKKINNITLAFFSLFFIGGIWELMRFSYYSFKSLRSVTEINKSIYQLNTDSKKTIDFNIKANSKYWYMIENPKKKPTKELTNPDRETMTTDNIYRLSIQKICH